MWRVAVSALLVGVCQTSAHGSHSAVGQRRSSRSAVVEAPSARSALVASSVLRGGQVAAAAEVAAGGKAAAPKKGAALTDVADEPLPTRLRLTVAAGEASDASLVEVHPDTLEALGLSGGDCVLVRGTKMRRTAAMVNGDAKLAVGEARLSAAAQNNVKLAEGGELMLETVSHPPSPSASRVPQPDHSRSGSPSSGPEPSPSPSPIVIPILTIAGRARGGRGAHAARGGAAAGAPLRGGPQGGPG
jgi:hypothetical protein